MTIKDAIQKMMSFYRAVEAVYAGLPEAVEASDAAEELERMQTLGINCEHCKFNDSGANACKECSIHWLAPIDQRKPLNYEPI